MGTLHVGQGSQKLEILTALEQSESGDQLILDPGVYDCDLIISDRTIRAASADRPILRGQITLFGNAHLVGLSFSDYRGALMVGQKAICLVEDCTFERSRGMIAIMVVSASLSLRGALFDETDPIVLDGDGAVLTIQHSTFLNCKTQAIKTGKGTLCTLEQVKILDCGMAAIYMVDGAKATLEDVEIKSLKQPAVLSSGAGTQATLSRCTLVAEGEAPMPTILLLVGDHSTVQAEGTQFENSKMPLYLKPSARATLKNVRFLNLGLGGAIRLEDNAELLLNSDLPMQEGEGVFPAVVLGGSGATVRASGVTLLVTQARNT